MAGPLEVIARLRAAYPGVREWWPVDRAYHAARGSDARFEVCVGAILTQNTAWANVERALANLKAQHLLEPRRLSRAAPPTLREAIRPAGFFNQKADYLRTFARYVATLKGGLDELFAGSLADVRTRLLSFTGIGEETADDILVYGAGLPSFVVDAYTRRLTRRLGLGTGDETYGDLQRVWSRRLVATAKAYGEAHAVLVEHAKQRCTARLPRCPGCPLQSICPQVGVEPEVFMQPPT